MTPEEKEIEEKKRYLSLYRIQQAKIRRISEMMSANPEKCELYKIQIKKARLLRDNIESDIQAVDGGILSELLAQKYLCGKSLEEISYCLNYSRRQIERLHIKALQRFKLDFKTFAKDQLLNSIGKVSDCQIMLNATDLYKMQAITESDITEIVIAIAAKNQAPNEMTAYGGEVPI